LTAMPRRPSSSSWLASLSSWEIRPFHLWSEADLALCNRLDPFEQVGILPTNQPPNVNAGCSPQGLVAPNYRHTLIYLNVSCLGLVPMTAANAAFCDTTRTPGNTCPNIRGNLGRDTIIGPGLFDIDFSVFKNNYVHKISETFNVQFRAEMFNVLNHTNFAPSSNLNPFVDTNGTPDPTFGQLTATQVPNRQIQLALKLSW